MIFQNRSYIGVFKIFLCIFKLTPMFWKRKFWKFFHGFKIAKKTWRWSKFFMEMNFLCFISIRIFDFSSRFFYDNPIFKICINHLICSPFFPSFLSFFSFSFFLFPYSLICKEISSAKSSSSSWLLCDPFIQVFSFLFLLFEMKFDVSIVHSIFYYYPIFKICKVIFICSSFFF